MRSARDLTAAALIREAAMRLFAEKGFAAVSVRDIASAAGVSPALVIHHYKTKDGLKAAVDERASAALREMLDEVLGDPERATDLEPMAALIGRRFAEEPVLPGYLRRLLVDGGAPATRLFRDLYEASVAAMRALQDAGLVRRAADEAARAVFLLANDMALFLLREQIVDVLGTDPLDERGMQRWGETVLDVYTHGIFTSEEPT